MNVYQLTKWYADVITTNNRYLFWYLAILKFGTHQEGEWVLCCTSPDKPPQFHVIPLFNFSFNGSLTEPELTFHNGYWKCRRGQCDVQVETSTWPIAESGTTIILGSLADTHSQPGPDTGPRSLATPMGKIDY